MSQLERKTWVNQKLVVFPKFPCLLIKRLLKLLLTDYRLPQVPTSKKEDSSSAVKVSKGAKQQEKSTN